MTAHCKLTSTARLKTEAKILRAQTTEGLTDRSHHLEPNLDMT